MDTNVRVLIQRAEDISDSGWKDDFVRLFGQINVKVQTVEIEALVENSDLAVFDLNIGDDIIGTTDVDIPKDRIVKGLAPLGISESLIRFLVHISNLFRGKFSTREIRKANLFTNTFVAVCIPFNGGKSFHLHLTKDQQAGGGISKQIESVGVDI